ncbi:MAG TPA: tRNA (adenosine(37)-N6)-threonylcarbamoyltransferase complex ATPase subunit type 1 TsaE [Lysobacter sp.]|jgi:tRNA threonylcarbamoyladenosine biosynthesis protein TsaE|nr:tRNA (adenosine(37)-N6)-threonylcarbamoyltransferase complex ATPase subunit type 1 TsaE [Lysobacter sp.]
MTTSYWLADSDSTDRLGRSLAQTRPPRAVVHLQGDLGAGKSTLARALLRALGVQGAIRSPTYTLVERYPLATGGEAWHLDLYRIGDPGELEYLGLDTDEVTLWLVEWPERGHGSLPAADLCIEMALEGDGRIAVLKPQTGSGHRWVERLAEVAPLALDS